MFIGHRHSLKLNSHVRSKFCWVPRQSSMLLFVGAKFEHKYIVWIARSATRFSSGLIWRASLVLFFLVFCWGVMVKSKRAPLSPASYRSSTRGLFIASHHIHGISTCYIRLMFAKHCLIWNIQFVLKYWWIRFWMTISFILVIRGRKVQ